MQNLKRCKGCDIEQPLDAFGKDQTQDDNHRRLCKVCYNARYYCPEKRREKHLKAAYGISSKKYVAMLEEQDHKCAICGAEAPHQHQGRLHVDHCHTGGHVRGLLCGACNRALGLLKDDPTRFLKAMAYLDE